MIRSLFFIGLLTFTASASELPFELKDGDRVALLGDTFIEREQYEGWIELAATTRFANRAVTFRNLGWSADTPAGSSRAGLSPVQAGLEAPDEGWKQLQIQLKTYRPTVLITGYGMASSLPGGQSADSFASDFTQLLDTAKSVAENQALRFIILGAPPRHLRPGETEASPPVISHRAALAAINLKLREIAAARKIPFVSLDALSTDASLSENGIHLNRKGYQAAAQEIERQLGWGKGAWSGNAAAEPLRLAILKKNEWFFHRSRPANMAYIFGFRKGEQGKNAGEIVEFDKLVTAADARIATLKDLSQASATPIPPARTESIFAAKTPQPAPTFTVADGYEITLWAENPLLNKPTQMNFDEKGRLWVASSEVYPQVEVGQTANDKIIILDDTDGDGKADTSTIFADGLLIPTGILPGDGGCYVGQSTDLLHFSDTDQDGKADTKRRVLSGFGTEDTHHNLHTLRRGPDGLLWMNQSIYTRTDTETPKGLVRLRSGGIMRYDPRAEELQTVFYGWCNPWGHQFDRYGQSFVTDGAGGGGINWAVPGAMYFTYARAEKILGSISPGGYPKFCGLEIIESPVFPADWQGSMITCDFRAHRIVRFNIADENSGYIAQEAGDILRTDSVNFRPIDVKIGPDGALYIADWANPIINHGEVDFRDPRRDREHGRIWRVSRKGAALTPRRDYAATADADLVKLLTADHRDQREQAMTALIERAAAPDLAAKSATTGRERLAALWFAHGRSAPNLDLLKTVLADETPEIRAAAVRISGDWLTAIGPEKSLEWLATAIADAHPRVRIEAIRVLGKIGGAQATDLALHSVSQPTDRFIDYALWLNLRDHGDAWLAALLDGTLPLEGREAALDFALANLPAERSIDTIRRLLPTPLPRDGSGPWLGLALRSADSAMISAVYAQLLSGGFDAPAATRAATGLTAAITDRQLKLAGDHSQLMPLLRGAAPDLRAALLRLGGVLKLEVFLDPLVVAATSSDQEMPLRLAAIEGLSHLETGWAKEKLLELTSGNFPTEIQRAAALALVRRHRAEALPALRTVADGLTSPTESRAFWQQVLSLRGLSAELAPAFQQKPLAPAVAALTLQSIPDVDAHTALLAVLRSQAGSAADSAYSAEEIFRLVGLVEKNGDAARGELVYRQAAIACTACHAIGGAGGKVGPDMTSIGASAPLDYLIESVVLPASKVKEGYHSVVLETNDGRSIIGQLLRSTNTSVVIRDAGGAEITVAADAITKRTDAGSLMPANLIDPLTEQQRIDLFKFLSVLGKPGAFDATKSRAPRTWAVLAVNEKTTKPATSGDAALPWAPVTGTVDGRLLHADAALFTAAAAEIFAATKLQTAEAGNVRLEFPSAPAGLWINGQPAQPGTDVSLPAGIHTIVVRHAAGADLRFESAAGTFLPTW